MPLNIPPPAHETDKGPDDWTPYSSRLSFETADFLYRHNQMSGSDTNLLFSLWAASLACHSDTPPFTKHAEMLETIDSTSLGDVAWESFSLKYNGDLPTGAGEAPSWMTAEHEVWFRDPQELVQNLLSNPDFASEFDYSPLQEYDKAENHRFQDFMSGNWAWEQAVSSRLFPMFHFSNLLRMKLRRTLPLMAQCLFQLYLEVTRQLFRWQRATISIGQYTYPLATFIILSVAHTEMVLFCSVSYLYQHVRYLIVDLLVIY